MTAPTPWALPTEGGGGGGGPADAQTVKAGAAESGLFHLRHPESFPFARRDLQKTKILS